VHNIATSRFNIEDTIVSDDVLVWFGLIVGCVLQLVVGMILPVCVYDHGMVAKAVAACFVCLHQVSTRIHSAARHH
jgi:hypothetical protein